MTPAAGSRVLAAVGLVALVAIGSFALPVDAWRSGETEHPPFVYDGARPAFQPTDRLWVDTDAACGTGAQRDPDDCLALLSLATATRLQIVGVSTVFGNAPLDITDRVTRDLMNEFDRPAGRAWAVFKGCEQPVENCVDRGGDAQAEAALLQALRAGELTYVAMGPLTNLAVVLRRNPEMANRIAGVIAVMGRRPGHRFHPSENRAPRALLFGHGPVFRDLNAVLDPDAVAIVLRSGIPLTLLPYTAARQVQLAEEHLDHVAQTMPAGAWVAERSRAWLGFWHDAVGIDGFYPFDLMAAAYLRDPASFRCARVDAWVGKAEALTWFDRSPALLVTQSSTVPAGADAKGRALYCDVVRLEVRALFDEGRGD